MARDLITITQTGTQFPQALNTAIESLRQARRDIQKVRDWMVHSQDGTVWTDLETTFGVPTGKGDEVFTLIDGTLQSLDGTLLGYANELMGRVAVL